MRTPSLAEELEAVAALGSTARRSDILSRVTDLFIYDAKRYSPDQVRLFGDVMTRLARGMGTEARARLAERLAPVATAPVNVIQVLALDEDATVAGSVLVQSERLSERDLLLIAGSKPQPHLLALARRVPLSQAVTDLLIARGDNAVLATLIRNSSARFSAAGWRRLHERSRADETLAAGLARRSEEEADEHSRTGSEAEVYRYAREGKLVETAAALAILSGIPSDAVERALLNPRADVLLVIAKAAGLSSITTEALVHLRAADRGMSAADVAQALAKFNRLPRDSARRVLNFFRIRLEKRSAPALPPDRTLELSKVPALANQ
jgi:uncharacterized protein (DUF2336 family)